MSAPTRDVADEVEYAALRIVNRELDRLEARLSADASRFRYDATKTEAQVLIDFLNGASLAHDAASDLVGRMREMLQRVASEARADSPASPPLASSPRGAKT